MIFKNLKEELTTTINVDFFRGYKEGSKDDFKGYKVGYRFGFLKDIKEDLRTIIDVDF